MILWETGGGGSWECKKTWKDRADYVYAVVFCPNNAMLATGGSGDYEINVYNVDSNYSLMRSV